MLPARAAVAALVSLWLAAGLLAASDPGTGRSSVTLEPGHGGLPVVRARINDSDPLRFLIDSGSNASAVSKRVAERLHLPDAGASQLIAIAGDARRRIVRVDALTIGAFRPRQLMPSVLEDARLAALGGGIDGVLGEDALGDSPYTVDYRLGEITWDQSPASKGQTAVTLELERSQGQWLVILPQDPNRRPGAGVPLRLVPDSGANAFVLFDRGRTLPIDWRPDGAPVPIATALGTRLGWPVRVRALAIGPIVLRDQPATVIPRHDQDGPMADGLLPLNAFARVTFDARAGTLTVFADTPTPPRR